MFDFLTKKYYSLVFPDKIPIVHKYEMKADITINERIKDLRTERGLTQKQLADAVGIAYSTYGDYEQDDYFIPHTVVITLAKYFGVTTDYLLGLSDNHTQINTPVKDLPFLEGCDTLMDLNICDTHVSDLSPLYRLKNLKRLWTGDMQCLEWAEKQRFLVYQRDRLEAWNFWTDIPTLYGWRGDEDGKIGHPRYEIIKAMFREGIYYDFDTVLRPEQYVYLYKKQPAG